MEIESVFHHRDLHRDAGITVFPPRARKQSGRCRHARTLHPGPRCVPSLSLIHI